MSGRNGYIRVQSSRRSRLPPSRSSDSPTPSVRGSSFYFKPLSRHTLRVASHKIKGSMPLGLYISVPFCRTKCSYCNFASDVFSKSAYENYVARVIEDIASSRQLASELGCALLGCALPGCALDDSADSIYLGGGTPSVLEAAQLLRIFAAVRGQFTVTPNAEITVECAPGTLTPVLIETLMQCGVNRVSLGV